MSQKDQGSFLTGFSLGLFVGAFGYLLFGTDRGEKIRADLSKEWDQAKDKLAQEGVINDPNANLRDVVHEYVAKIWGSQKAEKIVPSSKSRSQNPEPKNQTQKIKNKKTSTSTNKFKGV